MGEPVGTVVPLHEPDEFLDIRINSFKVDFPPLDYFGSPWGFMRARFYAESLSEIKTFYVNWIQFADGQEWGVDGVANKFYRLISEPVSLASWALGATILAAGIAAIRR